MPEIMFYYAFIYIKKRERKEKKEVCVAVVNVY